MLFSRSELHHEVALGNDMGLDPANRVDIATGGAEKLAGAFDSLGSSWCKAVVRERAVPLARFVPFAAEA